MVENSKLKVGGETGKFSQISGLNLILSDEWLIELICQVCISQYAILLDEKTYVVRLQSANLLISMINTMTHTQYWWLCTTSSETLKHKITELPTGNTSYLKCSKLNLNVISRQSTSWYNSPAQIQKSGADTAAASRTLSIHYYQWIEMVKGTNQRHISCSTHTKPNREWVQTTSSKQTRMTDELGAWI